jgi:hypothetical protein
MIVQMLRRAQARRRENEAGVTLVELVVTVVIIAIVSGGICTSLVLAVQQGPTVQHRSDFAATSAFLIRSISDDVANSEAAWPAAGASDDTCTAGGTVDLRTMPQYDGRSIEYRADISDGPFTVGGGVSVYEVEVSRTVTEVDDSSTSELLLTAYCTSGASLGAGASYSDPTYTLSLTLEVAPGADTRELALTAVRRTKLAASFSLTGSEFYDSDGDHSWDSPGETGKSGVSITVWDSTQSSQVESLVTDANGSFSVSLAAGSYVVCQTTPSGYTQTWPTAGTTGAVSCNSGGLGWVVTPAGASAINFGADLALACPVSPVPEALDPTTGNWPNNAGPDYWVFVNQGQSVQTAVDNAALADSSTTGDINGDGFLLIQVVAHDDASSGGSAAQAVQVSAAYTKPFGLLGCSVTLTGGGAGPAIWVKSTASAPTTTVAADNDGSANIYIGNLHGGNSATGVKIDGNGRYLRTAHATSNTAGGFVITGSSNTLYSGYATGNTGNGVSITGDSNLVTSSFDAMSSTGHGISIAGNSNTLDDVDAGESTTPNTLDGVHVAGNSNTLREVDAYKNGDDGVDITGNSNTIEDSTAGAHNKGNGDDGYFASGYGNYFDTNVAEENGGDGFDVSGASAAQTANRFRSDRSNTGYENVGAEYRLNGKIQNSGSNRADGTTVPKTSAPTKCNGAGVQFPSATTTFASVQVCE